MEISIHIETVSQKNQSLMKVLLNFQFIVFRCGSG
jgi:hypothetical protein